ncbi:hypothetical protein EJ07DRAFT_154348 [Lizonia empirigonia]|nr:hypothetical protein EJ07DRAFT_154348 [Lizonia empirigonia]
MTTISQWETYLRTALDPEDKGNGSYIVDHETRQGSSSTGLILIHFQPNSGESTVVMVVGLRQKPTVSVDASAEVAAQAIASYPPIQFLGNGVYYAVIEPWNGYMYFYQLSASNDETSLGAYKLGNERDYLVLRLLDNKRMYRV